MRRLANRLTSRIARTRPHRDERGVVLVFVAVTMVALIGALAMSVDVGRIYQERRELQNGADAAALAVAFDCASGDCGASQSTAEQYADANASDGAAGVESVDINLAAQRVTVYTATDDPVTGSDFEMTFAKVVGFDRLTVRARATVAWDYLEAGPVLPILLSSRIWNGVSNAGMVFALDEVNGTNPAQDPTVIYNRQSELSLDPDVSREQMGDNRFNWLTDSVDCSQDVEVGVLVERRARNPRNLNPMPPPDCTGSIMNAFVGQVSLIPFFVAEDNLGDVKEVAGIGALYITGVGPCDDAEPEAGPSYCIEGYFINDYLVDGPLGGADFGVSAIRFVSE